jgi:hypothetical protein
MPACSRFLLAIALLAAPVGIVRAADKPAAIPPEHQAFFEQKVRPILKSRCFECHSHAAKKDSGSLMLDSRGALVTGGDSGPALDLETPNESLLLTAVRYEEDYPRMPPKGKLPDAEIATLVEWVKLGAPWPGDDGAVAARPKEKITDEDRAYWAFQPPKKVEPPKVSDPNWSTNPIDRFIRAKLDAAELEPSPPADAEALIRRLYFDLIGLPPTPEEVAEFVSAYAPSLRPSVARSNAQGTSPQKPSEADPYVKLVDRLLASPRYGERWARHWLDLVRYAESDGYRIDDYRPEAWRYRDYVIRSLNADKPYDRFIAEQLAGDELAPDDPEALSATALLRLGIYEYNNRDVRGQWQNMLNDVTDVTADVFLGLGMGCARCHDHKFDPILQRDYFALQAFLAAMQPYDDLPLATKAEQAAHAEAMARWEKKAEAELKVLYEIEEPVRRKAARDAIGKFPEDIQAILAKPEHDRNPLEKQLGALAYRQVTYEFNRLDRQFKDKRKEQLVEARKQLQPFEASKPAPLPMGLTTRDVGREGPPVFIPKKGDDPIAPAFPTVLGDPPPAIAPPAGLESTGRRTALVKWLTRPDHPLTARVMVNRVWQYHFGRGIVATASDFGKLGEAPSHPELLDWLAVRFVEDGWSLKRLHRLMVTSRTYRQSVGLRSEAGRSTIAKRDPLLVDPENRLLWRMSTRRLDAEQVRDAVLAATGKLDLTEGGPSADFSKPRRSIYSRVLRNTHDPLLEVFDAPEGFQSAAGRNVTTTPTQALLMINGNYMLDQAAALASRLEKEHPTNDPVGRIEAAFKLCFGRVPRVDELSAARNFLARQSKQVEPAKAASGLAATTPENPAPLAHVKLERIPFRDGNALVLDPKGPMRRAEAADDPRLPSADFTIEAFVVLRSTFDDAQVRTIASHWTGDKSKPGWSFGVTSRRSQFKPQMLVLQMWGEDADGQPAYEPIFSSLNIELNKPYFVAVSVRQADTGPRGVTFYAKDLSNDDETLQSSESSHDVVRIPSGRGLFAVGGRGDRGFAGLWDGLIDDVRLSGAALTSAQLLLNAEQPTATTVGYWEFEPRSGVFQDASKHGLHLAAGGAKIAKPSADDPIRQAWIDFCHVLLNANEFIYVD